MYFCKVCRGDRRGKRVSGMMRFAWVLCGLMGERDAHLHVVENRAPQMKEVTMADIHTVQTPPAVAARPPAGDNVPRGVLFTMVLGGWGVLKGKFVSRQGRS